MRIVVDLQACQTESRYRGIGRYAMSVLKAMLSNPRSHEFFIILNDRFPSSIETIRGELVDLIPQDHIRVWYQPKGFAIGGAQDSWRRNVASLMREAFIQGMDADVVYVPSVFEGIDDEAVVTINEFFDGPPVAVTQHDLIPYLYPKKYLPTEGLRIAYYARIETLKRAALFLANSDCTSNELVNTLNVERALVTNASAGVSPLFCNMEIGESEKTQFLSRLGLNEDFILYAGGGDSRKNIEGLVRAYAQLPGMLSADYQLAVVGRVPLALKNDLQVLIAGLNPRAREICFIDYVADEDLVRLYNLCAVFILPSFHEGFGLPLVEAMACGAPAIGSNRTSIPEVLGRYHAMFDPSNIDEIVGKLSEVLSDKAFADRLRAEGLTQAKKFTWARSAEIALDAMEKLHERRQEKATALAVQEPEKKQRLAIIGNPPENATVRRHWVRVLEVMTRSFDVDLVVTNERLAGSSLPSGVRQLSVPEFEAAAFDYAYRVYRVTSKKSDRRIAEIAAEYPGCVIMEDFFLGELFLSDGLEGDNSDHIAALYKSHGYRPLLRLANGASVHELVTEFPCNISILRAAKVVCVPKKEHMECAQNLYGSWLADKLYCLDIFSASGGIESSPTAVEDRVSLFADLLKRVGTSEAVLLAGKVLALDSEVGPSRNDIEEVAECAAGNLSAFARQSQIFVDITELMANDGKSGIQRVVRAIVMELLRRNVPGYRVEPVFIRGDGGYCYARTYTARMANLKGDNVLEDAPIEARQGDIFLRLDLVLLGRDVELQRLRDHGVKVYEVAYDLLPVKWPEHFVEGMSHVFHRWLDETSHYADGVVCISKSVAEEFSDWLDGWQPKRWRPLKIDYFHLGADVERSVPTRGVDEDVEAALSDKEIDTFLMVGTIESRKGYRQVLDAFELLWEAGSPIRLVIIGRQGWLVDEVVARLKQHPEKGGRLLWLSNASDEVLLKFYERSDALILASEAEGYGLPLVEAARHGVPLIARDLPVFREVAGDGAFYFKGETGESLAEALKQWMALRHRGEEPQSSGVEVLTWQQSADQLLAVILGESWYREWVPQQRYFFSPARHVVSTEAGQICNHRVRSTGSGGLLAVSRTVPIPAGTYEVRLKLDIGEDNGDRMTWYEFVDASISHVLCRYWPEKSQQQNGEFVDTITFDHDLDAMSFRVWVAAGADVTFYSVELRPTVKAIDASSDETLAASASA